MSTDFAEVRDYFESDAVAHVATLMPDGAPHSVPAWVGVEGDRLAIFMIENSLKDRNLRADPRIAISVTSPGEPLDMAVVRGSAVDRLTDDAAMEVVDRIARRYTGAEYSLRSGLVAFLIEPRRSWANDYSAD